MSTALKGFYITLGAFLTLSILSFLYKDNIFYKAAEHLFVGVSAAYWMTMGFWTVLIPNLIGKLHPPIVRPFVPAIADQPANYFYLIPAVLGIMLLWRLSPKGPWISRWSLAFIVGTTAGLNFIRYMASDLLGQINSSMVPLVVLENGSLDTLTSISNIVIFLGVFCGLIYFFFSKEHKGAFGVGSRIGIWILMITFGAGFGYTVMARISLLVGRFQFLLGDWLGLLG
ncbi:MAG: hypothetical protein GF341_10770 [candidate division Zixibacteria bacterium]|nr:hypothetical protein [candidate division Zixibacteria bacterium]